jgi:hypothetical protein
MSIKHVMTLLPGSALPQTSPLTKAVPASCTLLAAAAATLLDIVDASC